MMTGKTKALNRSRLQHIPVTTESLRAPLLSSAALLRPSDCYDVSGDHESPLALEHLAPLSVIDGHQVLRVDDELLFSNDSLVDIRSLQRYPGERLRNTESLERFPVPDTVGEYCSREDFRRAPKFMAQWVHWPKRAELILQGRYHELPPVHMEGIFTLVCNFMCPHCSRRVTRTKWVEGGTWDNNTEIDRKNTMHPDGLRRVIDQLASMRVDEQMGIVWGGGDPTANPFVYDGMLYARRLGITASFLTNGVFLDVDRCLDADPILIRISLNCGTEEAYRRFHGYPKGWDYFERIKHKIRELARKKLERRARTLVGISLIMDERNIEDTLAAVEQIRAAVEDVGPGIDYVIVRPVFHYATTRYSKLSVDTKQRARDLIAEGGRVWTILDKLNIPLVPIKDSFDAPPTPESYQDTRCLAYGMCGEIRHTGDVQLCSDSYGNPDYTIGNLYEQSLADIWQSPRRTAVLEKINAKECYKTYCPHNSRGHHYNRLFHQIEAKRRNGQVEQVRQWMNDLRAVTLPMGHSFFI